MAKLQEGEQIDLNTATVDQVASIPNIGTQSARVLIAARPDEGFEGWDQVRKLVSGLGRTRSAS
jgi:DNA uptake protein ComE-like DNA-binding protein